LLLPATGAVHPADGLYPSPPAIGRASRSASGMGRTLSLFLLAPSTMTRWMIAISVLQRRLVIIANDGLRDFAVHAIGDFLDGRDVAADGLRDELIDNLPEL
jgi:hypothetical protein